jgi:hypothetical protein
VIVLCFVLLRESNPTSPETESKSEWSGNSVQGEDDNVAGMPSASTQPSLAPNTTQWQAERSSVASKPASPVSEPTPAPPLSQGPSEAPVEGWPTSLQAPEGIPPSPAQGWPTDLTETPDDEEPMFNAPLESAQRKSSPVLRTTQRPSRTLVIPSNPQRATGAAPYLNGTVEIPPPAPIYRK